MSERKREVKTYLVEMIYNHCGIGIMTGDYSVALATYPPQYVHVCPHCGFTENYSTAYRELSIRKLSRRRQNNENNPD